MISSASSSGAAGSAAHFDLEVHELVVDLGEDLDQGLVDAAGERAISARSSRVHTPSATRSSSFTNGSCRSSFFRKYSSTGLELDALFDAQAGEVAGRGVAQHDLERNIVTFLTSWEVSLHACHQVAVDAAL